MLYCQKDHGSAYIGRQRNVVFFWAASFSFPTLTEKEVDSWSISFNVALYQLNI